jgi:hypothetical protein
MSPHRLHRTIRLGCATPAANTSVASSTPHKLHGTVLDILSFLDDLGL